MNSGDTTWIMVSSALVLLMTPGLAFFYGGLVRENKVVNTLKMSFVALGVIALVWVFLGYSLAFAPGGSFIGGLDFAFLNGVGLDPSSYAPTVPHLGFMAFQMMFAIITPALISGAIVGRMKFSSYLAFITLWALCVYAPLAHWVWGGGWLGRIGALDFAGGTVVHVSAGVSALVAAKMLGPRQSSGHPSGNGEENPHNVPFVVLGASLLWFGWIGFNAGSALAADGIAVLALVNTVLGGSSAMLAWLGQQRMAGGRPGAVGASLGAVVGLVAVTPAAGFVSPAGAIAIGAIGSLASFQAVRLLKRTGLDDTLDVFACHGLGGIVGALLTGVFATTAMNPAGADGLLHGNASLVGIQAVGVLAAVLLAAVGTAGILTLVKATLGLRASTAAERHGIDAIEHEECAYLREPDFGAMVRELAG